MMRAIAAFLLLLAGGAEGRKPLFGQTGGDSNKCGAACEWFASAPVDGNADATCGNRVEYLGLGDLPAVARDGLGPHGLRR